jgi:hypothetical protein
LGHQADAVAEAATPITAIAPAVGPVARRVLTLMMASYRFRSYGSYRSSGGFAHARAVIPSPAPRTVTARHFQKFIAERSRPSCGCPDELDSYGFELVALTTWLYL